MGGYNTTTGIKDNATDKIRNKTPIFCKPSTQYYVCVNNSESSNAIRVLYYDRNMNFISTVAGNRNTIITTPTNAYYINIMCTTAYGTTYKNDICINISDSLNGTYTKITGTLAEQLEYVYQLMKSYKGQTNISQINNDLPFIIDSTALKDLTNL